MTLSGPSCSIERRRDDVRRSGRWNGIDYLEVDDDQLRLCVRFLEKAPEHVEVGNVVIEGGERIRDIQVIGVEIRRHPDPETDDCLEVVVDRPGDFSMYTLKLVDLDEEGRPSDRPLRDFDVRYAQIDFTFKAGCPSPLDCLDTEVCPPAPREDPLLDYIAKDYDSFRQLILDRLAMTMPEWKERQVPDLELMLAEILAYVGDHLSYYQDAVATEAYLASARRRISIRRHARLVDYAMHEGCNARAWVALESDTNLSLERGTVCFLTSPAEGVAARGIVPVERLDEMTRDGALVYEPIALDEGQDIEVRATHSVIRLYAWGDAECCLPIGSTTAVLRDHAIANTDVIDNRERERRSDTAERRKSSGNEEEEIPRVLELRGGDTVIFEEVKGARTGDAADADPRRRHAVRITRVQRYIDQLYEPPIPLLEIEWGREDALPFAVCLSSRGEAPDCELIEDVSVVRGNVVLVDHGCTVGPEDLGSVKGDPPVFSCDVCASGESEVRAGPFQVELQRTPLTFAESVDPQASAAALVKPERMRDPRAALAQVFLEGMVPNAKAAERWHVRRDLLESEPRDRHVALEVDDDGRGHLRFGDGDLGFRPAIGTTFRASYRIGNGPQGNVGPEMITGIVDRAGALSGAKLRARNPLAAIGGCAQETLEEVRNFAPNAYRAPLVRAVIPSDYATLARAAANDIQGASAIMRWTGGWHEMRVAVDPIGTSVASDRMLEDVDHRLYTARRIGHDLRVVAATAVSLDVCVEVCVAEGYLRGHVEAELKRVFSNRELSDGSLGFFHPDKLKFGSGIYISAIVSVAQRIAGVERVSVTRLERLFEGPAGEIEAGILTLGPTEIARLDNDPSFPERGTIIFEMRGGR